MPFDAAADWPPLLAQALAAYRAAWRVKMDAVNPCIAANAELEELVDQPETTPGVVRVAGPFSIKGVIALEQGLHDAAAASPIAGAPEALDTFEADADAASSDAISSSNAEAHLDKVLRLLKAAGVDFAGNHNQRFARPPALPAGRPWRVAVKVMDPRGNEGLRVLTLEGL